jgi:lysophospholipase L1-like esterase
MLIATQKTNSIREIAGRLHLLPLICALLLAGTLGAQTTNAPKSAPNLDPVRFERDINRYLASDRTNPPPQKAILFIGSSIFRLWEKLPEQMAPLPVFNRAFGGSVTTDVLHYMDKLVLPYEPRIIVYYCGSNDINAGRKAEEVCDGFRQFVGRVHAQLPETRIFYVSINRVPQKQDRWEVVDTANQLAREYCTRNRRLAYIDVNPTLFGADGQPRLELYQTDRLHFKAPAYKGFAAIIKPVIAEAWGNK